MTPERKARQTIDNMLEASGWHVHNYADRDISAALGVAVREYPLANAQRADYLLFVDGLAVGFIEAKKEGATLSGAAQQVSRYRTNIPAGVPTHQGCPFTYTSTGIETWFQDTRDPNSASRPVFAFHTPNALHDSLQSIPTLRQRLKRNLPFLEKDDLRGCQFRAIRDLEKSLAASNPRALIQMATGSGKTYAAVSAAYRLIRFARATRVLFLVDRRNLGRQTLREFQAYTTPDDGRKFTELYNVQHLSSNQIEATSAVCITTIQRLYSMLKGDSAYETEAEETSAFEQGTDSLSRESLWFAYKRRSPQNVRGNTEQQTDLISLVRFAMGESAFLEPFRLSVNRRFSEWLADQTFTAEQHQWLEMIRDHIATSLDIRMADFEYAPFAELGNGAKVYELFGADLDEMLKDLTEKLVS